MENATMQVERLDRSGPPPGCEMLAWPDDKMSRHEADARLRVVALPLQEVPRG